MTRNINWLRSDRRPILAFAASSKLSILEWLGANPPPLPPPRALILPIRAITTGAVIRVTAVCTSTGAAGAARRGTDHRRVRCANYGICRSMRNSAAERLDAVPSAEGGITRLAFAHALEKKIDVEALLRKADLSRTQVVDSHVRISVRSQVLFLDLVAKALADDLLGFHLAQNFDLRMIGLLFYVLASSETLGEALGRAARYSSIVNEGFRVTVREGREIDLVLESVGIPRRLNRHQIEFWFATFIRA